VAPRSALKFAPPSIHLSVAPTVKRTRTSASYVGMLAAQATRSLSPYLRDPAARKFAEPAASRPAGPVTPNVNEMASCFAHTDTVYVCGLVSDTENNFFFPSSLVHPCGFDLYIKYYLEKY
jgi:hypothetical protein